MDVHELTSLQNPKVKHLVKLRKRKVRQESQQFLIEGFRECLRAAQGGWPMESCFFCRDLFLGKNEDSLLEEFADRGMELYSCSIPVFRKISYRDRPDGLIALASQHHFGLEDVGELENPFLLLLVGIEKPGNLGTMLRSADAAGVDAVIVCEPVTDIFNPNTVRASVGTLFTVPVLEADLTSCTDWLREQGIPLLAATPHAERSLYETNVGGPVAVAVGSEMLGLDDAWLEQADLRVSLPMHGIADSLNVSSSAAIILYEVVRQRGSTVPSA